MTYKACTIPFTTGLGTAQSFAGWFKVAALPSSLIIFQRGEYGVAYANGSPVILLTSSNQIGLRMYDSPTTSTLLASSLTYPNDVWVHVVYTYGSNTMKLYVNGVLDTTEATVTADASSNTLSFNLMGTTQDIYYDDWAIFNRELTALEVSYLYNNGIGTEYLASTGSDLTVHNLTVQGVASFPLNGLTVGTSQLVTSGGNVGIGTTSPVSRLEVAGTISIPTDYGAGKYDIGQFGSYMARDASDGAVMLQAGQWGIRLNPISAYPVHINGAVNYGEDTSETDDYTVTITGITAYTTGMMVTFKAAHANTLACTLAINGMTAKSILKRQSTAMASNDILADMFCVCVYDGTNFIIMNPVVN